MRRRPGGSIVANPVLVGAVTLLVVNVAVFLAYNANNGLPFVPSQTLYAEMPSGADVSRGVEVREGGFRIGVVEDLKPDQLSNGKVGAVLQLKLDDTAGPYPKDSRVIIRPRSPLALKIVQFERGRSKQMFKDGQRVPVDQGEIRTDLDELYTLYDLPTREGVKGSLEGFGGAFAGRGTDLNTTIRELPQLLTVLRPVMANLSAPETGLPKFFSELNDAARVIAPVSREFARGFTFQADTFDAISKDPAALKATISKSPPTLDVSVRSLRVQRPFLADTAALSEDLEGAARDLRGALPPLNRALEVGTPVTRRTIPMDRQLQATLASLRDLAAAPTTNGAVRGLTATVTTLQPQLRFLGPYITVCNYWNIFWTFAAEHFTADAPTGGAQRVLLNQGARQQDSVAATLGANEYAVGHGVQEPRGVKQYTHSNTAGGNAIDKTGAADCTPGQQGYTYGANSGDDTPDKYYRRAVVDQLNNLLDDADKGSTFNKFDEHGRGSGRNPSAVPQGETFTDLPGGRASLTEHDQRVLRSRGQQP